MGLFTKLFGTRSDREVKKLQPTVDKILALETEYAALSEEALKAKTQEFKNRLEAGETLDDILVEAFATGSVCQLRAHDQYSTFLGAGFRSGETLDALVNILIQGMTVVAGNYNVGAAGFTAAQTA